MPSINPVRSAISAAQSQATQETNQLNKTSNNTYAPKTNNTVVATKTVAPQDQVTISTTARQAAATQPQQTQLQAQQAKPAVASGKDADTTGE